MCVFLDVAQESAPLSSPLTPWQPGVQLGGAAKRELLSWAPPQGSCSPHPTPKRPLCSEPQCGHLQCGESVPVLAGLTRAPHPRGVCEVWEGAAVWEGATLDGPAVPLGLARPSGSPVAKWPI